VGRNETARILSIGEATVTDILNTWRRGTENPSLDDYQALRDLAVHCKKEGFGTIADFGQALRIKNYLERLGLDVRDKEESVENFIATLAMQSDPIELIQVAGRIGQISDIPLSELEEGIKIKQAEKDALEAQKEALLTEIEERRRTLDAVEKAAEDFLAVKEEMEKCGIRGPDSTQFLNVIRTFQKYGSKIMNAFAEVMEINNVKRLKKETDDSQKALDTILSTLGVGLDQLKQIIISLMTLEDFGIDYEGILSLSRDLDLGRLRREQQQQWKRGQEWDVQLNQGNNGGQEYGYTNYWY